VAIGQGHVGVGRQQVNLIPVDGHALGDLAHGHPGRLAEDFRHMTFGVRVEMNGDQEGHARLRR
jgi:hypothetical protein